MDSYREFTQTIEVTNGRLYITNYEDLTMAAQFIDEKLPANQNSNLRIPIENGFYEARIRQLFDHQKGTTESNEKTDFEILFQPATKDRMIKADKVSWWKD